MDLTQSGLGYLLTSHSPLSITAPAQVGALSSPKHPSPLLVSPEESQRDLSGFRKKAQDKNRDFPPTQCDCSRPRDTRLTLHWLDRPGCRFPLCHQPCASGTLLTWSQTRFPHPSARGISVSLEALQGMTIKHPTHDCPLINACFHKKCRLRRDAGKCWKCIKVHL